MRRRTARPTVDLPQPDSPTSPKRLAARDAERHAVDRPHGDGRAAEGAGPGVEVLHEARDGENRLIVHPGAARTAHPAGDRMSWRCGLGQRRIVVLAPRDPQGTARREPTALRHPVDRGDGARNGTHPVAVPIGARHRGEEALGIGMERRVEDSLDRAGLDDRSGIHDRDPVGDLRHDAHGVRDQEDAHAAPAPQVLDQPEDLRLDRDVERRRRLVSEEDRRLAGERHRDHHALAHAAGELMRIFPRARGGGRDADQVEQADRLGARRFAAHPAVLDERLRDLEADGEDRVQRAHRLLEDHRHPVASDALHRVGIGADRGAPPAGRCPRSGCLPPAGGA